SRASAWQNEMTRRAFSICARAAGARERDCAIPKASLGEGCATRRPVDGLSADGSVSRLLTRFEGCPGTCLHIAQHGFLPGVFQVPVEKVFGDKIGAAGMAGSGSHAHSGCHRTVGSLPLNGSAGMKCVPLELAVAGEHRVAMSTQGTAVRRFLLFVSVVMVRHEFLGQIHVDLAFVLL